MGCRPRARSVLHCHGVLAPQANGRFEASSFPSSSESNVGQSGLRAHSLPWCFSPARGSCDRSCAGRKPAARGRKQVGSSQCGIFCICAFVVWLVVGWLVVWLVGWLVVCFFFLVVWLFGCLVVWLVVCFFFWLFGWLVGSGVVVVVAAAMCCCCRCRCRCPCPCRF